jgi:hypothetical protein
VGPGWLEPAASVFWDAVRAVEPSLFRGFNPWDDITDPARLLDLYEGADIPHATAEAVAATHRIDSRDDFWVIVMGSGLRATVDALSPDEVTRVREQVLTRLADEHVTDIGVDVVLGSARRP